MIRLGYESSSVTSSTRACLLSGRELASESGLVGRTSSAVLVPFAVALLFSDLLDFSPFLPFFFFGRSHSHSGMKDSTWINKIRKCLTKR